MEVFIHNLDGKLTRDDLHNKLGPTLLQHGISANSYEIRKPIGKTFAFLTILHTDPARRFLNHAQANPGLIQSSYGRMVTFRQSTKPPNDYILRILQKQEKEAQVKPTPQSTSRRLHHGQKETGSEKGISFWRVECGAFEGDEFVTYWRNDTSGPLKRVQKAICFTIDAATRYEAMVDINNMESLNISSSGNYMTILASLALAPKIYDRPKSDANLTTLLGGLSFRAIRPTSYRDIAFPSAEDSIAGTCLTYRFMLNQDLQHGSLERNLQLLTSYWVHIDRLRDQGQLRQLDFKKDITAIDDALKYFPWTFSVKFQVQAIWKNGILSPNQLRLLLPAMRALYQKLPESRILSMLRRISLQLRYADRAQLIAKNAINMLQRQASTTGDSFELTDTSKSRDEIMIHGVSITPTGIYLAGPEECVANRVLRRFRKHNDRFLRVTFGEEDEGRIEFSRDVSNERILRGKFLATLDKGLDIAGEHFEFLGFSHSSLRSQSCWFMRPFVHNGGAVNAKILISSLGDFSSIRCPAKCAARIGQTFSETQSAVHIDQGCVKTIPDVQHGRFLFTDGCGTISPELWKTLRRATNGKSQPTLYQIRYRGAKGMLSLNTRLSGKQLLLRPSMIKFLGSPSNDLEICGSNIKALPFKLNRPLVKILEDLGVQPEVFLDLQTNAIDTLRNSTTSKQKAVDLFPVSFQTPH